MDAGHQLREELGSVLTAVRLVKQQISQRSPVPAAMASVLGAIDSHATGHAAGGCHVKDLAARNVLDPSTVSRSVAALVKQGLVRRTADPDDGRASVLELTDEGRSALHDTHQRFEALLADALAGWDPQDLAEFAALLQRFAGDLLTSLGKGTSPEPLPTLEAAR